MTSVSHADLETALAGALDSLPTRGSSAATIGQRLGIDAAQIGLLAHRTRRRRQHDGRGQVQAAALVTRLPAKGETLHFLMDGNFRLADVVQVIQAHIGRPVALTICTLGLNDDTTDMLAANYDLMRRINRGSQMHSVWRMNAPAPDEKVFGDHPTQKPVALITRCLLAATCEGDWVFDPFLGSGTTAIACLRNRRRFVGIDESAEFVALAMNRTKTEAEQGINLFAVGPTA